MKLGPLKTAIRNYSGTITGPWRSSLFVAAEDNTVMVGFAKTMLIAALDDAYGKDNKVETGLTLDTETGVLTRLTAEGNTSTMGVP